MGKQLFEFMTHWDSPRPLWFKRDEEALIGTQRSGGRPMPRIKPFDLVKGSTSLPGVRPPVLWQGQDGVIEAHTLDGPEPVFHRAADYDVLVFQFTGNAAAETEYGEYHLSPGHSMHLPRAWRTACSALRAAGNWWSRPTSLSERPWTRTIH